MTQKLEFVKSSYSTGGDELTEMYCEQCKQFDDVDQTAEWFCVECLEYFCSRCATFHKRNLPNHTMQDRETMSHDYCLDHCLQHPQQLVKFFCETHNMTACKECKKIQHEDCKDVKHIPTLVADIKNSEELKQVRKTLQNLSEDIELIKYIMPTNEIIQDNEKTAINEMEKRHIILEKQMEDQYSSTKENLEKKAKAEIENNDVRFQKEREDMTKAFNEKLQNLTENYKKSKEEIRDSYNKEIEITLKKLREEQERLKKKHEDEKTKLANEIKKRSENDSERIRRNFKKADEILREVKQIETSINNQWMKNLKSGLFVAMKNAEKKIPQLKYETSEVQQNNHIHNYIFESGENITAHTDIRATDIAFGTLKEKSTEKRTLRTISKISTSLNDEKPGRISGMCQLNNAHIVIVDNSNCLLKVIDTTKQQLVASLRTENKPFDITKIPGNKVAVTFPQEGQIQFFQMSINDYNNGEISGEMEINKTDQIDVGDGCHGIACRWDNLVVSFTDEPIRVVIMDLNGQVLKALEKDATGKPLFEKPLYVTQGYNDKTIYVSDYQSAAVKRLNYTATSKDCPVVSLRSVCSMGITMDLFGTVYVLDGVNIHQLSSDLSFSHHLKSHKEQQVTPLGLLYGIQDKKLYEARWGFIHVYDIT